MEESGCYCDHASLTGQPDQLGYGSRPHLLHDPNPMHPDRLLADDQISGNVLVQPPGDGDYENVSLLLDQVGDLVYYRLHVSARFPSFRDATTFARFLPGAIGSPASR